MQLTEYSGAARPAASRHGAAATIATRERNTKRCSAVATASALPPRNNNTNVWSLQRARWNRDLVRPRASSHALNCHCPTSSKVTWLLNCACAKATASGPVMLMVCARNFVVMATSMGNSGYAGKNRICADVAGMSPVVRACRKYYPLQACRTPCPTNHPTLTRLPSRFRQNLALRAPGKVPTVK